jgi:hypothetical protein
MGKWIEHSSDRGDCGETCKKNIGTRHARQFVDRESVKFLSVTQPDVAVVRGNLVGWLLVWSLVSPNKRFFFTI